MTVDNRRKRSLSNALYRGAQAGVVYIGNRLRSSSRFTSPAAAAAASYGVQSAYNYYKRRKTGSGRSSSVSGGGQSLGTKRKKFVKRKRKVGFKKRISRMIKRVVSMPQTEIQKRYTQRGFHVTNAVNLIGWHTLAFRDSSALEAHLARYNPVVWDTTLTVKTEQDISSFKNVQLKLEKTVNQFEIRNAGLNPVKVRVYFFACTSNTDQHPRYGLEASANDLAQSDAGWETEPSIYMTTFAHIWRKAWKLVKTDAYILAPGEMQYATHKIGGGVYRPDTNDVEQKTYYKGLSYVAVVRIEGTPVHDSTTETDVGLSSSKVDVVSKITDKYRFQIVQHQRKDSLADLLGTIATEEFVAPQGDVTEENV